MFDSALSAAADAMQCALAHRPCRVLPIGCGLAVARAAPARATGFNLKAVFMETKAQAEVGSLTARRHAAALARSDTVAAAMSGRPANATGH
jgi:hypothetical protein